MAPPRTPGRPENDAGTAQQDQNGEPSFETSIRRLGEIVERLEAGDLPLEESLRLFEEGVRLARASQSKLEHAERRVEELLSIDENGNPLVREVETD